MGTGKIIEGRTIVVYPGKINLTALLLLTLPFLYSQDMSFERISVEEGLSQATVSCMLQDQKGFIWLGTQNGLNRFDGYSFKIYKHQPGNKNSLSGNYIKTILEDHRGNLWIGTLNSGLTRFNPSLMDFTVFRHNEKDSKSLSNDKVYALIEDRTHNLWVGTNDGLNRYQGDSKHFKVFRLDEKNLKSHHIRSLAEGPNVTLWVGTRKGLYHFDPFTQNAKIFINALSPAWERAFCNSWAICLLKLLRTSGLFRVMEATCSSIS